MKTGRPEYYVPSASTVSRDVRIVFARTRARIGQMLQVSFKLVSFYPMAANNSPTIKEHVGRINFATDAWTSPNHYAYVAVTAHLEVRGEPICIVLDVVELPVVRRYLDLYFRRR